MGKGITINGQCLRHVREELCLSQPEFGDAIGCGYRNIQRMESENRTAIGFPIFRNLASILKLSFDELRAKLCDSVTHGAADDDPSDDEPTPSLFSPPSTDSERAPMPDDDDDPVDDRLTVRMGSLLPYIREAAFAEERKPSNWVRLIVRRELIRIGRLTA